METTCIDHHTPAAATPSDVARSLTPLGRQVLALARAQADGLTRLAERDTTMVAERAGSGGGG